jgi:hypothetical protein
MALDPAQEACLLETTGQVAASRQRVTTRNRAPAGGSPAGGLRRHRDHAIVPKGFNIATRD